jgi:hypothetical protein
LAPAGFFASTLTLLVVGVIPIEEAPWLLQSPTAPLPEPAPLPTVEVSVPRHLLLLQRAKGIAAGPAKPGAQPQPAPKAVAPRDGTECDDPIVALLFDKDNRFSEVRTLLQSRLRASVPMNEDGVDVDWIREQQTLLDQIAQRTAALPVLPKAISSASRLQLSPAALRSPAALLRCR